MRKLKRRKQVSECSFDTVDFIHSGCSTMNLALSGKAKDGGWARARVLNLVGDRSAGKTAVALELAFSYFKTIKKIKSKIWPTVKRFHIVYNNPEGVMDFPIQKMYGKYNPKTGLWECPFRDKVEWVMSPNVEHFGRDYWRRANKLEKGESLLYILDTLDFLKSKKSIDRFIDAVEKDGEIEGSYDVEKQKFLSGWFPTTKDFLNANSADATLLILSQIRDKIGVMFGKKQMRTGGHAFDHAIHQEAWIKEVQKLRATRFGEQRVYAIKSEIRVEKNKCGKPFNEAQFQILYDYGIDNINSLIDYIYGKKTIKFDGQKFKTKKAFIKFIEENDYEELLEKEAEIKWQKTDEAFEKEVMQRKSRW